MNYIGHVIRPPSEAYSLILQVTVGCSHNMCTFCGTYKEVKFHIKDMSVINSDIDEASSCGIKWEKAFLADGDVLILPTSQLLDIINTLKKKNPTIERIGVYGNTKSIIKKTPAELKKLKDAGLGIVYQGVESGSEIVLRSIRKGALPDRIEESAKKVMDAGILLSQTYLLGIGGVELSREHAEQSGKLISRISPDYASALTLMILPNTTLHADIVAGKFKLPDKIGMVEELKIMIENINADKNIFFTSNHASNYVPVRANFPADKKNVLKLLGKIVSNRNESVLKPEYMRGL
jgi:radical SAM superfamily enzyme YgiQ (UPF0313 family)